jgi:hypothetical protein
VKVERDKWLDIGERPRHTDAPIWITYPSAPMTVFEARDFAFEKRLVLMHRHEEDRVVAQIYIPSESVRMAYMKGKPKPSKKGGKK